MQRIVCVSIVRCYERRTINPFLFLTVRKREVGIGYGVIRRRDVETRIRFLDTLSGNIFSLFVC